MCRQNQVDGAAVAAVTAVAATPGIAPVTAIARIVATATVAAVAADAADTAGSASAASGNDSNRGRIDGTDVVLRQHARRAHLEQHEPFLRIDGANFSRDDA